ncbi:hypothetical protein PGTUg99_033191 [Puccinia graminis f. sp. tritici]|uniref:Uncharacterized protein n=1 Tax=Puccinia graminis f. sp. tritici TaxID=56615 RepID=A0A5B0PH00_PUCGR|nr:hypothetical protein PGTUg99_033191 [Puccinia graminis f. sp. tritici]
MATAFLIKALSTLAAACFSFKAIEGGGSPHTINNEWTGGPKASCLLLFTG